VPPRAQVIRGERIEEYAGGKLHTLLRNIDVVTAFTFGGVSLPVRDAAGSVSEIGGGGHALLQNGKPGCCR
jgi:hypothetical protein